MTQSVQNDITEAAEIPDGRDPLRFKWQKREQGRRNKERLPSGQFNFAQHAKFGHTNGGGKKHHIVRDFRRLLRHPGGRARRKQGTSNCCGQPTAFLRQRLERRETRNAIEDALNEFSEHGINDPCSEFGEPRSEVRRYTISNAHNITSMEAALIAANIIPRR